MTDSLDERLNEILPKITSEEFLSSQGLGKDIAFFIFDYPPEAELRVREHIRFLLEHAPKQKHGLRVKHINLLEFVVEYLKERNLLERTLDMQREKGDAFTLKQLEKILHPEKLIPLFVQVVSPEQQDLVLVSGVGSIWPLVRTHSLLNNLHAPMGDTPLVLFYPGRYDGQTLRLFGKIKSDNYYRAFRLIP